MKQVVYNKKHLKNFIDFVRKPKHDIPEDKTMLEIIITILAGAPQDTLKRSQSQPSVAKIPGRQRRIEFSERFEK